MHLTTPAKTLLRAPLFGSVDAFWPVTSVTSDSCILPPSPPTLVTAVSGWKSKMAATRHFDYDQPPPHNLMGFRIAAVHKPRRFHENQRKTVCVMLFTDRWTDRRTGGQTVRQTDRHTETITLPLYKALYKCPITLLTSLAKVTIYDHLFCNECRYNSYNHRRRQAYQSWGFEGCDLGRGWV